MTFEKSDNAAVESYSLRSRTLIFYMNATFARSLGPINFCLALLAAIAPATRCQSKVQELAIVEGTVCDSQNRLLGDITVSLKSDDQARTIVVRSNLQGHYRFEAVPAGTYTLRASGRGYRDANEGPFVVPVKEVKPIVLRLQRQESPPSAKDSLSTVEFSDEPQFAVAGVTDPSNLGGHGSDTVLRTKEALARDAASLNYKDSSKANPGAHEDIADTHERLADDAEREGHPLEAVREYQRAAELEPNEAHLFAWGAELLLHRAFEPAIEVFTKGHRLYPDSVRILLGLSVATYDQGEVEQGEQLLLQACDQNPSDPTAYLFLGKLQEAEKIEPPGWTERFKRFVTLHSENALAHYYYAVALSKQSWEMENSAAVESELKQAVKLDPKLGNAYLQLGILSSAKKDATAAINAFQKAIENSPLPDEAHYRLAQIYRQAGETEKARQEMALYNQAEQQKTKEAEQRRHETQQFVYTLRGQSTPSSAPDVKPQ